MTSRPNQGKIEPTKISMAERDVSQRTSTIYGVLGEACVSLPTAARCSSHIGMRIGNRSWNAGCSSLFSPLSFTVT